MGLLDGLIGNALGGMLGHSGQAGQGQSALLQMALQLVQQNGGVEGLLDKFRQGGYADQAASWQSTGQNIPVTGNILQEVLGSGAIGQIAQQLGMSHGETAGGLAQVLPQLIDGFTPNGEVPENHDDMVEQALALLTRKQVG